MDDEAKNLARELDRNLLIELRFDDLLGSCAYPLHCDCRTIADKMRTRLDRAHATNTALRNAIAVAFQPDATMDDMRNLAMLAGLTERAPGARIPIQTTEATMFARFQDMRTRYGRRDDPMSAWNDDRSKSN
jgi:hypothetical protein